MYTITSTLGVAHNVVEANCLFQFPEGGDSYLTISGAAHPFLSAEVSYTIYCYIEV